MKLDDKEYTLDQLEQMTPMELCEIALELGIIKADELVENIWDMRGIDGASNAFRVKPDDRG